MLRQGPRLVSGVTSFGVPSPTLSHCRLDIAPTLTPGSCRGGGLTREGVLDLWPVLPEWGSLRLGETVPRKRKLCDCLACLG